MHKVNLRFYNCMLQAINQSYPNWRSSHISRFELSSMSWLSSQKNLRVPCQDLIKQMPRDRCQIPKPKSLQSFMAEIHAAHACSCMSAAWVPADWDRSGQRINVLIWNPEQALHSHSLSFGDKSCSDEIQYADRWNQEGLGMIPMILIKFSDP